MKPIVHVTQYTPTACVFACMEMYARFLGIKTSQLEIHREFKKYGDAPNLHGELRQWVRLGCLPYLPPSTDLHPGRVYMASVASLNNSGGQHRIVIDAREGGARVLDPNRGREGRRCYREFDGDDDGHPLIAWSELVILENCRQ